MVKRRKALVSIDWSEGWWEKTKARAQSVAREERKKGYYARIRKQASAVG